LRGTDSRGIHLFSKLSGGISNTFALGTRKSIAFDANGIAGLQGQDSSFLYNMAINREVNIFLTTIWIVKSTMIGKGKPGIINYETEKTDRIVPR